MRHGDMGQWTEADKQVVRERYPYLCGNKQLRKLGQSLPSGKIRPPTAIRQIWRSMMVTEGNVNNGSRSKPMWVSNIQKNLNGAPTRDSSAFWVAEDKQFVRDNFQKAHANKQLAKLGQSLPSGVIRTVSSIRKIWLKMKEEDEERINGTDRRKGVRYSREEEEYIKRYANKVHTRVIARKLKRINNNVVTKIASMGIKLSQMELPQNVEAPDFVPATYSDLFDQLQPSINEQFTSGQLTIQPSTPSDLTRMSDIRNLGPTVKEWAEWLGNEYRLNREQIKYLTVTMYALIKNCMETNLELE